MGFYNASKKIVDIILGFGSGQQTYLSATSYVMNVGVMFKSVQVKNSIYRIVQSFTNQRVIELGLDRYYSSILQKRIITREGINCQISRQRQNFKRLYENCTSAIQNNTEEKEKEKETSLTELHKYMYEIDQGTYTSSNIFAFRHLTGDRFIDEGAKELAG